MDLRQLRHFVAVAEELHFSRAAERLHMSQPPLSQSIQQLETELGVALFTRTRRKVELTPVGEQWLPDVRSVLAAAADLPDKAERLQRGVTGRLRLAFVSTAAVELLPGLVRRFRNQVPEVDVVLREATGDVQLAALQAGDLDAGLMIVAEPSALPRGLTGRTLHAEPLVAAVPTGWMETRWRGEKAVASADLADVPLILFPRAAAPALHDLITGYLANASAHPTVKQEAVQMQTIVGLVAAGLGAALVPASMATVGHTGVAYLPLDDQLPVVTTMLVWRDGNRPPTLDRLLELLSPDPSGS